MVRAKEESMRLTKRIRTGEKELSELEGKAEVVRQRVESLNRELKGIDKVGDLTIHFVSSQLGVPALGTHVNAAVHILDKSVPQIPFMHSAHKELEADACT
eukprot:1161042-Pelagomonas_calceolata.AAC.2